MKPEDRARQRIDQQLARAGWLVRDYGAHNTAAGPGVAVREFPLTTGFADYLLYASAKAIGLAEAKKEGAALTGIETQSDALAQEIADDLQTALDRFAPVVGKLKGQPTEVAHCEASLAARNGQSPRQLGWPARAVQTYPDAPPFLGRHPVVAASYRAM